MSPSMVFACTVCHIGLAALFLYVAADIKQGAYEELFPKQALLVIKVIHPGYQPPHVRLEWARKYQVAGIGILAMSFLWTIAAFTEARRLKQVGTHTSAPARPT